MFKLLLPILASFTMMQGSFPAHKSTRQVIYLDSGTTTIEASASGKNHNIKLDCDFYDPYGNLVRSDRNAYYCSAWTKLTLPSRVILVMRNNTDEDGTFSINLNHEN